MEKGEKKAIVVEKVNNGYKIETYNGDAAQETRSNYDAEDTHVAGTDAGAVEVLKDIFKVGGKSG